MSVVKRGDLLILSDDSAFRVLEQVEFEENDYLYGYIVPVNLVDSIDTSGLEPMFFVERVNVETKEVFMDKVEDVEIMNKLEEIILTRLENKRKNKTLN